MVCIRADWEHLVKHTLKKTEAVDDNLKHFFDLLLCARHSNKNLTYITHLISVTINVFILKPGNRGLEKLSNLSRVTE